MSEEKVFRARSWDKSPFHMAMVDIIIPFHGEHSRVSKLLESILSSVRTNRYRINLVDDASPNSSFVANFKKTPGINVIRHGTQKGFGAAVNTALKETSKPVGKNGVIPYVLIIQSDVVVDGPTWLSRLGESLVGLKDRGIKMVSPLTDNPMTDDERLQSSKHTLREEDVAMSTGFLPFYCVLAHRELFNRVGPMKEYPLAGGEAEEFAYRMRSQGFRQAVCGQSWVHHEGRATLANFDDKPKMQEILRNSKQLFEADVKRFKN